MSNNFHDFDILDSVESHIMEGSTSDQSPKDKTTETSQQDEKKLTIEFFGADLTKDVKDWFIDPIIGREKEINQMMFTLLRKTKNNPLLIGEAGVGKTAIVEWLAQKILSWNVPQKLQNKRIFLLDMGTLIAWTKYRGEFESRIKSILEEAADQTNNIILFIDELHTIIGAGNMEGAADVANMLKPLLARGKIKLIGATTFDEYQKHIEKDAALKRRFQEIHVGEPTNEDALSIIQWLKTKFEEYHGVHIADNAIEWAVHLSSRYMLNRHLPDKAIDVLDEACARKSTLSQKLESNTSYKKSEQKLKDIQAAIEKAIERQDYFYAAELKEQENAVKHKMGEMRLSSALPVHLRPSVILEDVGQVFADKLGIPLTVFTQSDREKLKKLDQLIKNDLHGQDESVQTIVNAVRRNKLSVIQRNKPLASFLFLGPSGTGKTFMAKLLAKHVFDNEKSLIRVDMSEYMEKHSVSKLIWSAPGYVGYEESGVLTEAVRRNPYSVILFDEIEKAESWVLNILLQILDEGHLKDNKGRMVDFKSTIIILTSNLGSDKFGSKLAQVGFTTAGDGMQQQHAFEKIKERVMEDVKTFMAPELMNRLDSILIFKPLSKEILAQLFKKKLQEFFAQWKKKEEVTIPAYSDKKIAEIIETIYDPQFGARPLDRYIHNDIEPKLIEQLLK